VLGQQVGVSSSVLAQEPRRALDVREQERDRSRRELPPAHGAIIAWAA
jgi:hypothetical protein